MFCYQGNHAKLLLDTIFALNKKKTKTQCSLSHYPIYSLRCVEFKNVTKPLTGSVKDTFQIDVFYSVKHLMKSQ